mmetsp:Transcript_14908/g.20829  ORF Transcript_14908/g.20829 Transcript_14908/m.20829 type:complete len:161 (-) Transcript_14908:41-523(-)
MADKESTHKGTVRLQWDPDHYPNGDPHPFRKAIQLGLKNVQTFINGDDILRIIDVTELANTNYVHIKAKNYDSLITPLEKPYPLKDTEGAAKDQGALRLAITFKGHQKVVVLQDRTLRDLEDLIFRKFKLKPKLIALPSGEELTQKALNSLPQGASLKVS